MFRFFARLFARLRARFSRRSRPRGIYYINGPDVLVFDEPTAHLDIETELALKETMLELMDGKLVFFATHRLHWMREMDRVIVIEDGRIVEQGTCEELLGANGAFARLAAEARGGAR